MSHCDRTESFKQLNHSGTNHYHFAQRRKTALWRFITFCVGEMEQKQAIWCLKRKSLNINSLFIKLLYKINITFVIMHILKKKRLSLHVILTMWNINIYIFCPISWILRSLLMHFNTESCSEALIARVHCLTPSSPRMRALCRRFVWFLQNTRYCQIAHR